MAAEDITQCTEWRWSGKIVCAARFAKPSLGGRTGVVDELSYITQPGGNDSVADTRLKRRVTPWRSKSKLEVQVQVRGPRSS